jgi:hypothetical protein
MRIFVMISLVKAPPDSPEFLSHTFKRIAEQRKKGRPLEDAILEEYEPLSKDVDDTLFQDSCSVRNVLTTRALANLLIDEAGHLDETLLADAIEILKKSLYSLGPERQFDGKRQEQILRALEKLKKDKDLKKILLSISKPHHHKYADQILRNTLDMPPFATLTDAHARRAVLAAWMGFLRQNVGSCFATAPAILVHNEQPHQFLHDVSEMLSTGQLKRVFGGNEYSVPLSPTWGKGDLKKPVLIQRTKEGLLPQIWRSPGLIKALEVVGIKLDENLVAKVFGGNQPFFITDAEKTIKLILQHQLKISAKDLKEEENRPKPLPLMAPVVEATNRFKVFYDKLELACNAFKALSENALLKAWEFTIASFAETKQEFTRWNLYSSLGLKPEEKGGIGYCIYLVLQGRLERYNEKVRALQSEYEQLYAQLKMLEGRMRRASTEDEIKWLKVEYQSRGNEFYTVEEMRNDAHQKAQKIANLFDVLINHYFRLFPYYFQEVYDADMQDVETGPFDDSPAGFRLMYKHGRTNTAQWTMIHNADEYVSALVSFFTSTEVEISSSEDMEGAQEELTQIVTDIVNHVRTREFLETSFYRMAIAHQTQPIANPLENLDKIAKKPWVYTSGGAMAPLVSTYFRREGKPESVDCWVENPMELLVFLVDTIKQIPPRVSQLVFNDGINSFIMHSPTHAFLLKPKLPLFMQAYQSEEFTYTWLRDRGIEPMKQFVYKLTLDEEMIEYLLERLRTRLPEHFAHHFSRTRLVNLYGKMAPKEFRNILLEHFQEDPELRKLGGSLLSTEEIDSELYSLLPLFRSSDLKQRLTDIFSELMPAKDEIEEICEVIGNHRMMDAKMLKNICLAILCFKLKNTRAAVDYQWEVAQAARKHGYAAPLPFIFADTNWVKDYFGFVYNPMSEELELWRVDYTGMEGAPMHSWAKWVDGSMKQPTWGIYTNIQQYLA